MTGDDKAPGRSGDDATKALRFLAVKAAVFMLLPLAVAALVVYLTLK